MYIGNPKTQQSKTTTTKPTHTKTKNQRFATKANLNPP